MATLTVRDLADDVRDRLRIQAAEHGRSMEAEARAILTEAVSPIELTILDVLMSLRERLGNVDLDPYLPARDDLVRDPFT